MRQETLDQSAFFTHHQNWIESDVSFPQLMCLRTHADARACNATNGVYFPGAIVIIIVVVVLIVISRVQKRHKVSGWLLQTNKQKLRKKKNQTNEWLNVSYTVYEPSWYVGARIAYGIHPILCMYTCTTKYHTYVIRNFWFYSAPHTEYRRII